LKRHTRSDLMRHKQEPENRRVMSATTRNFVIAYVILVLLPLVGLLGILRQGRNLAAPVSVDGNWKLQVDSNQLSAMPCGKSLASAQAAAVTISQSGRNFTLNLANGPKATASGVIDGTALKASVQPSAAWASETGCGSDRVLTLSATVDPKANPKSLVGMLSVEGCPACTPVELRAIREVQAEGKRGR
jgi:hypothetical protein